METSIHSEVIKILREQLIAKDKQIAALTATIKAQAEGARHKPSTKRTSTERKPKARKRMGASINRLTSRGKAQHNRHIKTRHTVKQ